MEYIDKCYIYPLVNTLSRGGVLLKDTKVVVINIFKSEDTEERDKTLKEILIKHLSKELSASSFEKT